MTDAPGSRREEEVEVLAGGIGNAGSVLRVGDEVHRPTSAHSPAIHALLRHVRAADFDGVPELLGLTDDGRERLRFIPGDVAFPPYPAWADDESILTSAARLLRRFHDAQDGFVLPPDATWSDEMADPDPGPEPVICHNDLCLENLVVRDGEVVGILDLEFAAPGRRTHDVADLARYLGPMESPQRIAAMGRDPHLDPAARLRLVVDAYGLAGDDRAEVVAVLGGQIERGGRFVLDRVEAGEPAFVEMWESMGGMARYDERRAWFGDRRDALLAAVS